MRESTLEPANPKKCRCAWKVIGTICVCLLVWFIATSVSRIHGTMQAFDSGDNLRELGGESPTFYEKDHAGHYPNPGSAICFAKRCLMIIEPNRFIVGWGSATPATGATQNQRADQMDAGGHCSYAYLAAGRTEQDVTPYSVLMYEDDGVNPTGEVYCLFGDGHGETLTVSEAIKAIIRTVRESDRSPTTQPTTQNISHTTPSN